MPRLAGSLRLASHAPLHVDTIILSAQAAAVGQDIKVTLLGLASLPLALGLAAGMTAGVIYLVVRRRPSPAERERRRRTEVNAKGRMTTATVLDVRDDQLYFSYAVGGVEYNAAQDISAVRDRMPADPAALVGLATVKYRPANPADSIVVSEEWSGLRGLPAPPGHEDEERSPL
jgi:hypothetical protein